MDRATPVHRGGIYGPFRRKRCAVTHVITHERIISGPTLTRYLRRSDRDEVADLRRYRTVVVREQALRRFDHDYHFPDSRDWRGGDPRP